MLPSIDKQHRGGALIEFAIVLPLLLFVAFAVFEMGNILIHDNALSKAVRDSARYIAREGGISDCSNVVAEGLITNAVNPVSPAVPVITNSTIYIEPICVNSSGALDPSKTPIIDITNPTVSCGSVAYFNTFNTSYCSSGYDLHIRVRASYTHTAMLGLTIPTIGSTNYTPPLSAVSIMMVP